jgi:hypothetical protein
MARQPGVFVRSLDPEEAQRLVRITRTTKERVRLRRHPPKRTRLPATSADSTRRSNLGGHADR